jgi:ATP phosphoribosyltransferase regulatory subunit
MSEFEAHLGLLPAGFMDLMPEDAEKEAYAITRLMAIFAGYGYRRIKPPLVEFEDSLLAPGPGAALAPDTFRMMDPVSHRMLGLRADITPQIARIVCTRLPKDVTPIRLTYANDVLRSRAGQLRTARQFCQVGCEIIRDDSVESYLELCVLMALGLKALGIQDITLDFTIPRALDEILDAAKLEAHTQRAVKKSIASRNRDDVAAMGDLPEGLRETLIAILDNSGAAQKILPLLKSLNLPPAIAAEVEKLGVLIEKFTTALSDMGIKDVSLTCDPFEVKGFEYQGGIGFTLFSKHIRGELGRGGFYEVSFGSQAKMSAPRGGVKEKAIGFTFYMDTIRAAVMLSEETRVLAVSRDVSWPECQKLRAQGWTIIRTDAVVSKFDPQGCTHIYINGKIEEL